MGNGDEDSQLSKDFSDLLERASVRAVKGKRGKRRRKAQNEANQKEKVTPQNALSANDKNGSVRDIAKRFEAAPSDPSDSQSTLSLGTETTASATTTTTAKTSENIDQNKTIDGGNPKPSTQPSAKVLMAQAAFSGTPAITEMLPAKRTSTSSITEKLPPKKQTLGSSDKNKINDSPKPKPSPQPSAKVLMAQAAFSGTPTITEKLPPKRTSVDIKSNGQNKTPTIMEKLPAKKRTFDAGSGGQDKIAEPVKPKPPPQQSSKVLMAKAAFSGTSTISEKVLPKRTSKSVGVRNSFFAQASKSPDASSPPSTKLAWAPKQVQSPFSSPAPPITKILPQKRTSASAPQAKASQSGSSESSQFFKLAQAAFSGFAETPGLSSQNKPIHQQKRSPPTTRKVSLTPTPSPKMKVAHEMFSGTPAIAPHLPPKRTSVAPKKPPVPSNPGFFAAWSNINALTQTSNSTPTPPTTSYGFGKSPSLAIPPVVPQMGPPQPQPAQTSEQSVSQHRHHATQRGPQTTPVPVHQPMPPLPRRHDENSILLSPEQQEAYKEKSRILKDPVASTTEKLRMYLTSVQQESAGLEKKTEVGEDAKLHPVDLLSQTHVVPEIADDSDESQEGSDGSHSDSSPTFPGMISKSIDKVIWNYSDTASYSDNPSTLPEIETTLASNKRNRFVDVDIAKEGVDEFDFVEDDDDLFHDEYGTVSYEKYRQRKLRGAAFICASIAACIMVSFAIFGLGLVEISHEEDDIGGWKIPPGPWTGDCFTHKVELRMAIDRYVQDGSKTTKVAQKYGWPINSWCVSEIEDFSYLFRAKVGAGGSPVRLSNFNEDISSWDVSNGRFFNEMFLGASFNQDVSEWNVGNAVDMEGMFDDSSFTGDLSSWDVKNVKNTKFMFRNARNFNSDLSRWQLAPDTMEGMFMNAETFSSDLNGFNVSNVRDFASVFAGASSFNGDISAWDMRSAERLDSLFENAELFDGDLSNWAVKPTSMDSTFSGTSSFTGRKGLEGWDTSLVNDMHRVFAFSKFQGDISTWNLTSVTTVKEMFLGSKSFDGNVSKWDVSNVKDFSSMFDGAEAFSSDLSSWDVSSGTKFERMFAGCASFNKDLSMWNIASVRTMMNMFANATSYSKDLCAWGPKVLQTVEDPDDLTVAQWTLFQGTSCPEAGTLPDFAASPPGPFCQPCGFY